MAPQAEALARQVQWNEQELPETAYYRLRDMDLSGVAMRTALMDVIDRATEVASNLAGALSQADEMGLTIAQVLELPGFSAAEIGTYEARSFEHSYPVPDLFPETPREKAEGARAEAEALSAYKEAGLLEEGLERLGFEDAAGLAAKAQTSTEPDPLAAAARRLLPSVNTRTGGGGQPGEGE